MFIEIECFVKLEKHEKALEELENAFKISMTNNVNEEQVIFCIILVNVHES